MLYIWQNQPLAKHVSMCMHTSSYAPCGAAQPADLIPNPKPYASPASPGIKIRAGMPASFEVSRCISSGTLSHRSWLILLPLFFSSYLGTGRKPICHTDTRRAHRAPQPCHIRCNDPYSVLAADTLCSPIPEENLR